MNTLRRALLTLSLLAVLLPLRPCAAPAPEHEAEPASAAEEETETPEEILLDNLWWMLPITGGVFLLGGGGLLLWVRRGGMDALEDHWGDADTDEDTE